ncbi:hypothetical protein PFISCL1PPCAC_26738, partial [Pristionchus fissidentatus]
AAAPVAAVSAAAAMSGGQITAAMEEGHAKQPPEHHNRFFGALLRLCENTADAFYVRKKGPEMGADNNRAGEQHTEFSSRCIKPTSPFIEPSASDRKLMDLLHTRCTSLTGYCAAIFPTMTVTSILHADPTAWGLRLPNEIKPELVRIVTATIEYKKKLTDVKLLNDWFDIFKVTKKPSDMYSAFVNHYTSKGVVNIHHQAEVTSKMIERAIENVSLEWAEARMRLCDYISRLVFNKDKMELIPACAKALLDEVDRICALDPIQPEEPSMAHGVFTQPENAAPLWLPFTESDREHLVIPAAQYLEIKQSPTTSANGEDGEDPPFKRRRPTQIRTSTGASPPGADQPSTSGMAAAPFAAPANIAFHLPPSQMQALSQIQAAAAAEQAARAAAAAAPTVALPVAPAAQLLLQLNGAAMQQQLLLH